MPLLLLGIVTIAFCISRLIPADPLASIVGVRQLNNPTIVAAARQKWGLNGSIFEQYWAFLKNLVRGDLGISFRTRK
ncbi:MAG: peptide ABC transporter permease, partial [Ilumatobacteraceae bacterium]|nr:peptide ABC transporter permease [Ilumatobacteraceae bacterium]